jgi:hypothetical protein
MSNIFLREPTYITVDEVKDTTDKAWLSWLTDDEIKILISKAEDSIDRYIWRYWTKFNENQTLIFPIDNDWVSFIPWDIKVACFYVCEQIFETWDNITGATSWWTGAISSEKTGDRAVTYSVWTETTNNVNKQLGIPIEAETILKKYKKIFYKSSI